MTHAELQAESIARLELERKVAELKTLVVQNHANHDRTIGQAWAGYGQLRTDHDQLRADHDKLVEDYKIVLGLLREKGIVRPHKKSRAGDKA